MRPEFPRAQIDVPHAMLVVGAQGWYGPGPVSVLPECQRQGIGAALIREGLARLKAMNARGCCLVGHPGYYGRLGLRKPPDVFFALSCDGRVPHGEVAFHDGFKAES